MIGSSVTSPFSFNLSTRNRLFYFWFLPLSRILRTGYSASVYCNTFFRVLGPINTRTGNYSAKYLFYPYDDVVAMILPVTGFRLECAKINRVESDNYPQ